MCSRRDSQAKIEASTVQQPTPKLNSSTVPPVPAPKIPSSKEAGNFVVHVIDVGTGLAVFVEGPDFTMIYDGGSNDDLRDERSNRLTAYLRAVRPDLRNVLLSHAHRDHVELLPDVLNDYEVHDVWEPGVLAKVCAYQRFVHALSTHPHINYHTAAAGPGLRTFEFPKSSCQVPREVTVTYGTAIAEGNVVKLGLDASMKFLHVDREQHANLNENSLVVRLSLGDKSVLLMGDAEAGGRNSPEASPLPESTEGRVLARYAKELRSDVLVAGHHGSKTSTRRVFLDAVAPRLSVVSGGPHAYSGHTLPDREIVDLLAERGPVFRTDVDDTACMSERTCQNWA